MLVVMQSHASEEQVRAVCQRIESLGLKAHPIPGTIRTAIGITGNKGAVDLGVLESMSGVIECIPVSKPYKLVSRDAKEEDSVLRIPTPSGDVIVGGEKVALVAGPCAVESEEQCFAIAERVVKSGVRLFRGGAYKPRTSPYSFQGMGEAGLKILAKVREKFGFGIITEAIDSESLDLVEDYARRKGWIEGKFGLFGHSRGGGIAILFAAAEGSNVSSLVTWAAISYPNRWSPEDTVAWRKRGYTEITNSRTGQVMRLETDLLDDVELHGKTKLNIEAAAGKIKVPWLIVHGTADETVPSTEAEHLHSLSKGVSTLRLIERGNHGFDAKHPLSDVPPMLEKVVKETVRFFVRNAIVK